MKIRTQLLIVIIILPAISLLLALFVTISGLTDQRVNLETLANMSQIRQRSLSMQLLVEKYGLLAERSDAANSKANFSDSLLAIVNERQIGRLTNIWAKPSTSLAALDSVYSKLLAMEQQFEIYDFNQMLFAAVRVNNSIYVFDITSDLESLIESRNYKTAFLVNKEGEIVYSSDDEISKDYLLENNPAAIKEVVSSKSSIGTVIRKNAAGERYLYAFSKFPGSQFTLIDETSYSVLMRSVFATVLKLGLIFFVCIFIGVLFSQFIFSILVKRIEIIKAAMGRVATGDFNFQVDLKGGDEIGQLGQSLNTTIRELQDYEKLREQEIYRDNDMAMAQQVQENFFPKLESVEHVYSYSRMADRCGGDWHFYLSLDGCEYLIIADATGHGMQAALVTGSVRAVLSTLQGSLKPSPSQILTKMNRAVFDSVRGDVNMTMVVLRYDPMSHILTYSNASHDPPYFFKQEGEEYSLSFLDESVGRRLGEQADTEYSDIELACKSGDSLFLYTDGIFDLVNNQKGPLKERIFLKKLQEWLKPNSAVTGVGQKTLDFLETYHTASQFNDDWSFTLFNAR